MDSEVHAEARAFVEREWEHVLDDLGAIVRIDSSADLNTRCEGAPYGQRPRAVLDEMMRIMRAGGFEPHDCEGHCAYAELEGSSSRQLAIMAHLDVVPAGSGWSVEPFELTYRDGYLMGRGVIDDKGALMMAFHALRFWRERFERRGERAPLHVRMICGCNEETGMADADYYLETRGAPDFLFTPDAEFPLCYGEKGTYQIRLHGKVLTGGAIARLEAGTVINAVPGAASALVCCRSSELPVAEGISVEAVDAKSALVRAQGKAAHASTPQGSVNALGILSAYLLANVPCGEYERAWLEFVNRAASCTDGSSLGIACADEDFGALTCVAGMASTDEDGRFIQAMDVRFPAAGSLEQLRDAFARLAKPLGARIEVVGEMHPLLVPPDSAQVTALRRAYEQVTGREARLFTMGGSTYAHHFPRAVSFGPVDGDLFPAPAWAGGMHAADEAIAIEALRQALLIYIVALGELFELDWS